MLVSFHVEKLFCAGKKLIVDISQFILITKTIFLPSHPRYVTHLSCSIYCKKSHSLFFRLSFYRHRTYAFNAQNDGTQLEFNHAKHILLCCQHL